MAMVALRDVTRHVIISGHVQLRSRHSASVPSKVTAVLIRPPAGFMRLISQWDVIESAIAARRAFLQMTKNGKAIDQ